MATVIGGRGLLVVFLQKCCCCCCYKCRARKCLGGVNFLLNLIIFISKNGEKNSSKNRKIFSLFFPQKKKLPFIIFWIKNEKSPSCERNFATKTKQKKTLAVTAARIGQKFSHQNMRPPHSLPLLQSRESTPAPRVACTWPSIVWSMALRSVRLGVTVIYYAGFIIL